MYFVKVIYDGTENNKNFSDRHAEYLAANGCCYCIKDTANNGKGVSGNVWSVEDVARLGVGFKKKNGMYFKKQKELCDSETSWGFYNVTCEWVEI